MTGSIGYVLPAVEKGASVKDPRFPQRTHAFGDEYRETFCAGLPMFKSKMKAREREAYNNTAGGVRTTQDPSYHAVHVRGLAQLARAAPHLKEEMLRLSQPPALPDGVDPQFISKGHPLVWQEIKPIKLWSSIFRNFDVGHIYNLTECSGAAAIAAHRMGIGYEGVCASIQHMAWCDRLMDKSALALYADGQAMRGEGEFQFRGRGFPA